VTCIDRARMGRVCLANQFRAMTSWVSVWAVEPRVGDRLDRATRKPARETPSRPSFLERRRARVARGMLIDDAPCRCRSSRTWSPCATRPAGSAFLCYLRARDRLADFINHKTLFRCGSSSNDYFEWAAAQSTTSCLRP